MSSPEPAPPRSANRRWVMALRFAVAALILLVLSRVVRTNDVKRAIGMVGDAGWPLVLVLAPTLVAMSLDALGWRAILATLGHGVRWLLMLELRLSVEALVLALPGGSVAGEVAKVALLRRRSGIPLSAGTASLALTKLQLIASDAFYLLVIAIALAIEDGGPHTLTVRLALGGFAVTAVATVAMALVLRRSRLAARMAAALGRLPIARLRRWVQVQEPHFQELDTAARAHFTARWQTRLGCFVPFMLEWLVEGVETFIILRFLGLASSLGIGEILALDGITSFLRAIIVVVPAGLGVQDATQVMLLRQFGVADPIATGAALIFIKRTKEVFWIVMGLSFLAVRRDLWRR